ncbi:hypothetical protein ACFSUS_00635 [Spirosoma soli]|uniref:YfhO family protein n=1 Tax=Spirosoma soli TaxID=1770529 RepID=A0ABW5LXY4_9BACT
MTPRDQPNQTLSTRPDQTRSHRASSPTAATSAGWSLGAWLFVALPVVVFGLVWQYYAVNVPKWDDHALRHFLYLFDQETTISGKIYQLFKQHNEHRIVYDRIITVIDYWLFGKLNYIHLMIVGNLAVVGLLAIFISVLRRSGRSVFYAVPVAFLLFNLSQWENMFWGMAALQNFSVVLWIVLALYLLSYTNRLSLAVLSAVLATLTSGNGLTVWPLGAVLLVLRLNDRQRNAEQRRFNPLISWLGSAALVIGLYFYGFKQPGDITYVQPGLVALLKGWFAVIGAAAEAFPVGSALTNSTLLGCLMVVITLGGIGWGVTTNWRTILQTLGQLTSSSTYSSANKTVLSSATLFFWSCAAFVLGTAAIVAWTRTGFGAHLLITSRYKLYSLLLLLLLYTYAIIELPQRIGRWVNGIGIIGSISLAWLSYYTFLSEAMWWRHWLLTNQFNWTYSTNRPVVRLDPVTLKYTKPQPAFYDKVLPTLYGPGNQPVVPIRITKTSAGYSIQNETIPALGLRDEGAYIVARSSRRTYLFPTRQNQASVSKTKLLPGRQFSTGFSSVISPAELEAGTYQLFVLTVANQTTLSPTNQIIRSTGQPVDMSKKNW